MPAFEGQRPRTQAEVRDYVYGKSSEDNRKALLRLHTDRTIVRASLALEHPWKWLGRYDAMRILIAAAPRYVKLGGNLNPWADRDDRPADWEVEREARAADHAARHAALQITSVPERQRETS